MKGKITPFEIALSAVACAFSTIFLTLGITNNYLLASGYIIGCFALMLPLAKGFLVGDVLAYIATVLLTFLFGGAAVPWRLMPFILVFGIHPAINFLQLKYKWNFIVSTVIKAAWFDASAYLIWRFLFNMTTTFSWIDTYIIPVILVGGTLAFILYDKLIFDCQIVVNKLVYRIYKK